MTVGTEVLDEIEEDVVAPPAETEDAEEIVAESTVEEVEEVEEETPPPAKAKAPAAPAAPKIAPKVAKPVPPAKPAVQAPVAQQRRTPTPTPPPAPVARRVGEAEPLDDTPAEVTIPRGYLPQAEVDRMVGDARTKARRTTFDFISKELGIPLVDGNGSTSVDPLKALMDEAKGVRDAKDSKIGELEAARADLEGQVVERDSRISAALAYAEHVLRTGKAELIANRLGFSDTEDAIALLGDLGQFAVDLEAGTVAGLEKALAKLAEKKPYLIKGAAPATPTTPIPPTPNESSAKARQAEQEAEEQARRATIQTQAQTYF
jgi:hypothetical protein